MLGENPSLKICSACLGPLFSTPAVTERLGDSIAGPSFPAVQPNDAHL